MSTSTTTTPIAQTNDATARVWVTEISGQLDLYVPKTTDTGQINLATFVRAAINTAAGYEIREFTDSLAATAPIVIKFEYGSGAAQDRPAMWITVGTGSNGSGTITGIIMARSMVSGSNLGSLVSTVTNYPAFFCGIDGVFGMVYKVGAYSASSASTNSSIAQLHIQRTTDSSGAVTAEGCTIHFSDSTNARVSAYCANFATSAVYGQSNLYTMAPFGITNTLVSGGLQLFAHAYVLPEIRTAAFSISALAAEVGDLVTVTATPVGLTSRTFLSVGNAGGSASANAVATHRFCMLYE